MTSQLSILLESKHLNILKTDYDFSMKQKKSRVAPQRVIHYFFLCN